MRRALGDSPRQTATEVLEALPQCARRGAAGATSLLGVVFLLVGFSLFLLETLNMRFDDAIDTALLASVLAWAVSAWRWGSPPYAAAAAISLFLFLGRLPHGRVLWALVGVALAGLAARRLDEASWAPSHRRGAAILVVAGILAAYAAVNVYSFDEHLLEDLGRFGAARVAPSPSLIVATALATAVVPLLVLMWGVRSRRTFVLDTGVVLLALSLVTLRHYVHLAPLWVILALSGAALVVLALAVERALRRAPGGEIAGVTAKVEVDRLRLRPAEISSLVGDPAKLRKLGWEPSRTVREALRDVLQEARAAAGGGG